MKIKYGIFSVIALLLVAQACKDKDCVGNDCPLSDGTFCVNNMINVNNECVCPEGMIEFNQNCLVNHGQNSYILDDLNCNCLSKAAFTLSEDQGCRIYVVTPYDTLDILSTNYVGTPENFTISLNYPAVKCNQLSFDGYPQFRGIVINDTLNLTILWILPQSGTVDVIETCQDIKIPRM